MTDLFNYKRRPTTVTRVGPVAIGSDFPVRLQSMTTTSTNDTEACVAQAERIIDAGGELVRMTTQGTREARNMQAIRRRLTADGYTQPIVADVHFNPNVADVAALYADKVRINPGNYVDPARVFKHIEYTDEQYADELHKIEQRFLPFLDTCRRNNTAIRIGVNHGSLSDRIMSRYGDTPEGIVESCMEFLRLCRRVNFNDVVISIKASNTVVMVRSVRLLVDAMDREDMHYPLHLGVTEAGEGEDGRIRSAVGIGALLADGIGDTIRVSLSEDPEDEIPVARRLVDIITARQGHEPIQASAAPCFDYLHPQRRSTTTVGMIGDNNVPVVFGADCQPQDFDMLTVTAPHDVNSSLLGSKPQTVVLCTAHHRNPVGQVRAVAHTMMNAGLSNPLVVRLDSAAKTLEDFQLETAAILGPLLIDGLVDGLWLNSLTGIDADAVTATAFNILQAARQRTTKTEYISCPGCGRTLYDLRTAIARIKEATDGMVGLKIAVMGCIVNGPGEMADADYGYVGAGIGKVSLYRRQQCVERNIPEQDAVERLLRLINNDRQTTHPGSGLDLPSPA